MTVEQMERFVWVAQMGVACGLDHPYEWFRNYELHFLPTIPYEETLVEYRKTLEAFVAFFRGTDAEPDDPVRNLTNEQFLDRMTDYYRRGGV